MQTWYHDIGYAERKSPADIKAVYRNASFVANNRVVLNIRGYHYRLLVLGEYVNKRVRIRFFGTHEEYDTVDASKI